MLSAELLQCYQLHCLIHLLLLVLALALRGDACKENYFLFP